MLTMKRHIKKIWEEFQGSSYEKQMVVTSDGEHLCFYAISEKETATSGELSKTKLLKATNILRGRNVLVVHNHPTHTPYPSNYDYLQYTKLHAYFMGLGIRLVDYAIVSSYGYYSFAEHNELLKLPNDLLPVGKAEPIEQFPHFYFSSDVKKDSDYLITCLNDHHEILHAQNETIGGTPLSYPFLLEKERHYRGKCLLFLKSTSPARLFSLYHALEPIEIYVQNEDKLEAVLFPH